MFEISKKNIFRAVKISVCLAVVGAGFLVAMNFEIINFSKGYSYPGPGSSPEVQAVMILGARVSSSGILSDMYRDRADTAIEVYRSGKAEKILVSGDHGRIEYDEVNAAKNYLLSKGIPAEDIFLDHAGFDTYDSLYRARDIFQVKSLIISTQDFHLPRAVYIARKLGIEAWGASADRHVYGREQFYESREFLSRAKAWLEVLLRAKPKFLGEAIPITGDSRPSWDEN
ncbi:MAG: ElyC/SanA/YdcF family protein [Candidatus Paceibacterota bacterium]|jgi:vancomycin permeability regulator SanA